MPPIIPDRFREEERTDHIFKIVTMLQSHNRQGMIFLHCSNAKPLRLPISEDRVSPVQFLRVGLRLSGIGMGGLSQ